ncbi:hypothetical protein VRK_09100 [Vibrio sp. MEBiC08052]|nr:hypothetical protein VRK_09100 [Vibrio sp. MEBiC08052]
MVSTTYIIILSDPFRSQLNKVRLTHKATSVQIEGREQRTETMYHFSVIC